MINSNQRWYIQLLQDPLTACALFFVLLFCLTAIAAPLIAIHDPALLNPTSRLRPPSWDNWFGTDQLGRDVFSRALYGARVSLAIGAICGLVVLVTGAILGLLAGYVRWLDTVIMAVMDGLMAVPAVLLGVASLMAIGSNTFGLIFAISLPFLPEITRLTRSLALTIRNEPFVEAAVMAGTGTARILWRHILPNAVAPLIVLTSYVAASSIIAEAILSFIGIGTPPELPSWGNMIADGRNSFQRAPWVIFVPSTFLALVVLAINIIGDRMRDVTDPLSHGGH
uniref:ABC transporter permease subunit n=1 Tax=Rhizobium laguerreae TaxID=1076926 RepID=A0A6N9ZRG7_9HYPH|nr:ABC transporter permease subunit [Rhizobium laguerreae]